jgi:membrane protease YdiL (CAAX protease family)
MGPRTRRFVAMLGVLVFVAVWIWGAIAIRGLLPPGSLIDLLVYAVAGVGWGVPLYPLFKWAEGGRDER